MTRLSAVALAATLLGASACSPDDGTAARRSSERRGDTSTTRPEDGDRTVARLADSECPDPAAASAGFRCHTLVVPEDRAEPTGRQVELPVLRSGDPGAGVPVVVLHGGPGGGVVDDWALWSTIDLGAAGELVLYDQRGSGRAVPRLDCPEHAEAMQEVLATTDPWEDERGVVADALARCHDRLTAGGVDLDQYDTPTSTRDLEDLRIALGAEQLTLVGQSYGTRLALDYLRTHPDRVRALVLDGVDPPGTATADATLARAAVDRLVAACAEDDTCAARHPDLGPSIEDVLRTFDRSPRSVPLEPLDGGVASTMELTGDDLYAGLFAAMYDTEVVPLLPSLVETLRTDGGALLDTVSSMVLTGLSSTATGALMSVDCADAGDASAASTTADPGRAATIALAGSLSFCDEWPVEAVGSDFDDEVELTDPPPVLVVAGELDPVTPADDAARVAERLSATYVEVPRAGHSPMLAEPCTTAVLRSFLATPERPDVGCVAQLRPRPFA